MNKDPKYKIGQFVKVNHWTGETDLTMVYVPEGYLRPVAKTRT